MSLVLDILDGTQDLSRYKNSLAINDAIVGKNIEMKGSGTGIVIADKTSIQNIFATGGTIACWMYKTSQGENNNGRLYTKNRHEVIIAASDTIVSFKQKFSGDDGIWLITTLGLGLWQHLMITYNAASPDNSPLAYVNSVPANVTLSSAPTGIFTPDAGLQLEIGYSSVLARVWDGGIADLKFFKKIISANYIKDYVEKTEKFY